MRMRELVEKARFPNSRLTHYGNDLTMACSCLFKCFSKLLGFSIASDKSSESSSEPLLAAETARLQLR